MIRTKKILNCRADIKEFETAFDLNGVELTVIGAIRVYPDGEWDLENWDIKDNADKAAQLNSSDVSNAVWELDFTELANKKYEEMAQAELDHKKETRELRIDAALQDWKDRKFSC